MPEPYARDEGRPPPGRQPEIAVLVPCHDEERTVEQVVKDFRTALPEATVYVYDNISRDRTAELARLAGAVVRREPRLGKGRVIRSMFADVEADVYVMADGDGTYNAQAAPMMVERLLADRLDMVVGVRRPAIDEDSYPPGHALGNALFSLAVRTLFGGQFTDVFSGYRVMSRRFVKSFPVSSTGFEIETELTAHAVRVMARSDELETSYRGRAEGSSSKLRTVRDGLRILATVVRLFEEVRPMQFFGIIATVLSAAAVALGAPVVAEWAHTGLVERFPTAILAASIEIVAVLSLGAGVILRRVGHTQDDALRLAYLQVPHVAARWDVEQTGRSASELRGRDSNSQPND
jgi:glycosyltransferase involved in cell wall biosynthesis